MISLLRVSIFFFLCFFILEKSPLASSVKPPLVAKIYGEKRFYITDQKARPKEVKVGSRIPFGSQFKLPPKMSVKISYSPSLFFLASNQTHIRILKRKSQPHIRILYGKMRLFLNSLDPTSHKRKKDSLKEAFYLESNEFVALLKLGKKKRGDFVFERSPLRTALYNLDGKAWTAETFSDLDKKKILLALTPSEYTYGRLDKASKFKKKHRFETKLFFKTLFSSSPQLVTPSSTSKASKQRSKWSKRRKKKK